MIWLIWKAKSTYTLVHSKYFSRNKVKHKTSKPTHGTCIPGLNTRTILPSRSWKLALYNFPVAPSMATSSWIFFIYYSILHYIYTPNQWNHNKTQLNLPSEYPQAYTLISTWVCPPTSSSTCPHSNYELPDISSDNYQCSTSSFVQIRARLHP